MSFIVRFQHTTDKFNLSLSDWQLNWRLNQIFDIIKISKTLTFQGKFDIIKLKLSEPKQDTVVVLKDFLRDISNPQIVLIFQGLSAAQPLFL